jgi:LysM repeat protein
LGHENKIKIELIFQSILQKRIDFVTSLMLYSLYLKSVTECAIRDIYLSHLYEKETKMTKLIRSLILTVVLATILTSCNLFNNDTPTPQATPALLPTGVVIELTVQADTSVPFTTVGQVIKYNYNVKNIGTLPAPGPVTIPGAACPAINTVGNLDASLDINEIVVCTSSYAIMQDDLNKGAVTTLTMANVGGVNSNQVTTTVATVPPTILKLTKTANPVTYDQVGQTITYTYVITNSGAPTLGPAQFTVSDTGFSTPINCGAATTTLAQNMTVTCSAIYTITQANMDAGSVTTSATASGGAVPPSQPASATVTKGTAAPSNPNLVAGSTIKHQVVEGEWLWQIARCYGANPTAVSAANPPTPAQISPNTTVTVPNIGSVGKIYGPPCITTYTVLAGDTWNSIALKFNADPTVLQMANKNTLTVGGVIKVPLNSAGATVANPIATVPTATLSLVTGASPATYNQVGQVITITYVIKNSGTNTLGPAQFTVTDALFGTAAFNCGAANTTLTPNTTVSCTAAYNITQANLSVASISTNATASGGGAGPSQPASTTIIKQ